MKKNLEDYEETKIEKMRKTKIVEVNSEHREETVAREAVAPKEFKPVAETIQVQTKTIEETFDSV